MISNDKLVYIHIQKCGGSFIGDFLINEFKAKYDGNRHSEYTSLAKKDRDKVVFTSVRNPLDWYVSLYHKHKAALDKSFFKSSFKGTENFDEWIRKFLNIKFKKLHDLNFLKLNYFGIGPYTYRLMKAIYTEDITRKIVRGKLNFDHLKIIKLENINYELSTLLAEIYSFDKEKQLTLETNLSERPKTNKGVHGHFSEYYSEESENLVREKDKIIFDYFGY